MDTDVKDSQAEPVAWEPLVFDCAIEGTTKCDDLIRAGQV